MNVSPTLQCAIFFALCFSVVNAVAAGDDYIRGRVLNAAGKTEAGVWVIAETDDLATKYRKIVVTNDAGEFLVPELPKARFRLWVRGYGLLDSAPANVARGQSLDITVRRAPDARAAAAVYPASQWLSLLALPASEQFEARDEPYESDIAWTHQFKLNCILCHQLGSAITRLPSAEAFDHGLLKAGGMNYFAAQLGRQRLLDTLSAWGKRIREGAAPSAPQRPMGVARNFVITQWEWGDHYTYAHDEVATDKRDPSVNAGGPVYGVDIANDYLLILDPNTHHARRVRVPTRGGFDTPWCDQTYQSLGSDEVEVFGFGSLGCPWPGGVTAHQDKYWNPANPHNPMLDREGRVWMTTQIRRQWARDLPHFCHSDAEIMGQRHHRQLAYYDPESERFELVDTCYGTHHLQFDEHDVLWTSGDDYVIGWLDAKKFDPKDPTSLQAAHGYSQVRLDSDGDGEADHALVGFHYGVIPNPQDNSVWSAIPPGISSAPGESGWILRFDRKTHRHEAYAPPAPGSGPRGVDVDSQGLVWTALAGSGHLARFDRQRCRQTWGVGEQCPEGWTLWRTPGPAFAGADNEDLGHTDMHYYLWVDQFNTLGMGHDIVIINGTNSDSLIAFDPAMERFTVIRIPYPLNTYTRGLDGRIDAPRNGWKGRGLWFTNGLDPILHSEVPRSYVGKIQLRPDPLAH